ncbi:MAG: vitamin K epoxide reductase family protein [Candidatus Micrarchaeales archaeon]|nr:vitamin K epoxide reductase family protein [Candidatus Micrarchaeales archaeon]
MNRKIFYALAIIGIIVEIYLTIVKYQSSLLVCPNTGVINCESVLTSPYSEILGVPVSILGIILFALAPLFVFKYGENGRFLWSIAGAGAVLYSIVSQAIIGSVCIYCLTADLMIILLLVLIFLDGRKKV